MSELLRVYREAAKRSIPIEVMLELTHHCNFRCEHCYIPDFSAPDLLSTERILRLLDELVEAGTLVLALSGGEILLRRDWIEIARQARRLGFDLHLFTNGALVDDDAADRIAALDATTHVSLYTLDAEVFDRFVERVGAFAPVERGIRRLRDRGARVILKVPLMTFNYRELARLSAYAAEIGAELRASPFVTAKKNGDRSPLRFRVLQEELARELGGPILGCTDGPEPDRDAPLCAAGSRYACITSAGEVMACNILPGSDANIRERSFRDVWENSVWLKRVRSLRRSDLRECGTCSRYAYCGRCQAQALVEDGDLLGPSSYSRKRAELIEAGRLELASGG